MGLSRMAQQFPEEDLDRVRQAVAAAEAVTGGEIVPYLVEASDDYDGAVWEGGALGAVGACLVVAGVQWGLGLWAAPLVAWLVLPALAGLAMGLLAVRWIPPLRRALVPPATLDRRTELRAAAAFVEAEVFATRNRTGILLFVSTFEHRVVILADNGIHARVEQEVWDGVAADLAAGIRAGRGGDALVAAVERCGRILEEAGVPLRPDDVDELPNEPVRRTR